MAKRIRKPLIKPEVRREWLRRNEENGESPPQIAAKDGYDVRTVRKQIELAKQERESREARSLVLRNALERHYDDLRNYAEMLNSQIIGAGNVEPSQDSEFMEAALRQHLPRSPIWSHMSKLQNLEQKVEEQQQKVKTLIEQAVKAESRLTPLVNAGLNGVIPSIVKVLDHQAEQWSRGYPGLNLKDDLFTEPAGEGFVNLCYAIFHILDRMDMEHAEQYKEIVRTTLEDLESRLRESEEIRALEKALAEIVRVRRKLREELAIIRLRRIVPGRCKYCPL